MPLVAVPSYYWERESQSKASLRPLTLWEDFWGSPFITARLEPRPYPAAPDMSGCEEDLDIGDGG